MEQKEKSLNNQIEEYLEERDKKKEKFRAAIIGASCGAIAGMTVFNLINLNKELD